MRHLLSDAVTQVADRTGRPPVVLEVGAGHGPFTETLASTGARVIVTEMSGPSARVLARRFRHNAHVEVVHDPEGSLDGVVEVDVVVYTSVLHCAATVLPAVMTTLVETMLPAPMRTGRPRRMRAWWST